MINLVRLIYQRPDYCKIMSALVDITEEWIENDYLSCNLEIIARITNREAECGDHCGRFFKDLELQ